MKETYSQNPKLTITKRQIQEKSALESKLENLNIITTLVDMKESNQKDSNGLSKKWSFFSATTDMFK